MTLIDRFIILEQWDMKCVRQRKLSFLGLIAD